MEVEHVCALRRCRSFLSIHFFGDGLVSVLPRPKAKHFHGETTQTPLVRHAREGVISGRRQL